MRTITNIILVITIPLIGGCCEVARSEISSLEKQSINEKQNVDAIGWLLDLCEDAVTSFCGTVFPEDYEGHSSDYADAPTYQQWQNIDALNCFRVILETLVNGSSSGSNTWLADPYEWHGNQRYGRYGCYESWMR